MKYLYYIELVNKDTNEYLLQSKNFKQKAQAKKWLVQNIDYIDFYNIYVNIMQTTQDFVEDSKICEIIGQNDFFYLAKRYERKGE